jgi:hypothetical protein
MGQIHRSIAFELGRVLAFTLGAIWNVRHADDAQRAAPAAQLDKELEVGVLVLGARAAEAGVPPHDGERAAERAAQRRLGHAEPGLADRLSRPDQRVRARSGRRGGGDGGHGER